MLFRPINKVLFAPTHFHRGVGMSRTDTHTFCSSYLYLTVSSHLASTHLPRRVKLTNHIFLIKLFYLFSASFLFLSFSFSMSYHMIKILYFATYAVFYLPILCMICINKNWPFKT